MLPSPNKLYRHLKLFSCRMPVSYSLTSLRKNSVNNILVVHIGESRNKSACTLLYSCTMLLHYRARTSTLPRAELSTDCAVHIKYWYRFHACTGIGQPLSLSWSHMIIFKQAFWLAYPFSEHADSAQPRNPLRPDCLLHGEHMTVWWRDYSLTWDRHWPVWVLFGSVH